MAPGRHHKPSTITEILRYIASDLGIVVIVTLVLFGVYEIDTITPLGQPVWLLYFIPLFLSFWSIRISAIPTVCVVTLLFLVGGFVVSPAGIPVTEAILNRFIFFLAFICISLILWAVRRRQILAENLA